VSHPGPMSRDDADRAPPPSDLELMLWADGELGAERASEVAAYVARDPRARAVVDSLHVTGSLLAEHALLVAHASGADAIAENVIDISELEASRRLISSKPVTRKVFTWRGPAVTAFGLAFAAAAAWFVFFRMTEISPLANAPEVAALSTAPSALAPMDSATASIEVVDFGSRPGTIFYVPSEGESVAVVWLSDDDSSPATGDLP
jgi:anti-sigma factor RsiW